MCVSAFSRTLPCGSHMTLVNYTGTTQQGPWRRWGCAALGAGSGAQVQEAVLEDRVPCPLSSPRSGIF